MPAAVRTGWRASRTGSRRRRRAAGRRPAGGFPGRP